MDKEASSGIETRANVPHNAAKKSAFRSRRTAVVLVLCAGVAGAIVVGRADRAVPARCPEGRFPLGYRCCWKGQRLVDGHCVGTSQTCTAPYQRRGTRCVLEPSRVSIAAGELHVVPNDWQAEGRVEVRVVSLPAFALDRTEVRRASGDEPDLPLTGLDAPSAEAWCEQRGGRLPTVDEWTFAASGREGRRYPWGQTGLVCRRAVYGLRRGPCAVSERAGPDAVGSRPDGASPEGLLDMVGNVAEWARDGETYVAMGGSWNSELASQLKVWSREAAQGPRDDIGFRCAYPVADTRSQRP